MIKITPYLLIGAALYAASSLTAATLAYESFDYATASGSTIGDSLVGANGGSGFSSAWSQQNPNDETSTPYTPVISPGFTYTSYGATGNRSNTVGDNRDPESGGASWDTAARRTMNTTYGTDSSEVWVSVLMNYSNGNIAQVGGLYFSNTGTDSFLIGKPIGSGTGRANWGLGKSIAADGSATSSSQSSVGANGDPTVRLFVARISFGASNADTMDLWIDPVIANGTPSNGSIAATLSGDFTFNGIGFAGGTGQNTSFGFDEFRLGTDFASVASITVPEPSYYASLTAIAIFGLVWLRKRRR